MTSDLPGGGEGGRKINKSEPTGLMKFIETAGTHGEVYMEILLHLQSL